MSIEADISPEAVKRLAKDHDTVGGDPVRYVMIHPHHWKTAKVLRKLSARVEFCVISHEFGGETIWKGSKKPPKPQPKPTTPR